jgi:hypothetical protein
MPAVAGIPAADAANELNERNDTIMKTYPIPAYTLACLLALVPATLSAAQRTFATPEEAIQATIDAAEHNDTAALLQIFGPGGKDIVQSGDPAEDKDLRGEFARAAHEKLDVERDPLMPDKVSFTVGGDGWPFPVPVVRREGKWQLDASAGRLEILARRIGQNELTPWRFAAAMRKPNWNSPRALMTGTVWSSTPRELSAATERKTASTILLRLDSQPLPTARKSSRLTMATTFARSGRRVPTRPAELLIMW